MQNSSRPLSRLGRLLLSKDLDERLLHEPGNLAQEAKQRAHAEAPALDADGPNEEVDEEPVGEDEDEEDTKVAPLLARVDVEAGEVLVAGAVLAVFAVASGLRVEQIAAGLLGEGAGILAAGLSWWSVEFGGLFFGTFNGKAVQGCSQDTTDPVSGRVDPVHPVFPEDREGRVGSDNAVEEREHDEEEREDVGDDGEGGCEGANPLAPGCLEQEEEHDHQEDVAGD